MHCTVCRLPSAYNRAVVDTVDGETLGCLCTSCIESFFGRSLSEVEPTDRTCVLCDRDGFYALPKWQCRTVDDGHRVVIVDLDPTVTASTPRLCDRHYASLRDSAAEARNGRRDPVGPHNP